MIWNKLSRGSRGDYLKSRDQMEGIGRKKHKCFFGLEKRNSGKNHIRCIKDDSGKMYKVTVDILYIY